MEQPHSIRTPGGAVVAIGRPLRIQYDVSLYYTRPHDVQGVSAGGTLTWTAGECEYSARFLSLEVRDGVIVPTYEE